MSNKKDYKQIKWLLDVLLQRLKKYLATFKATGKTMESLEWQKTADSWQLLGANWLAPALDGRGPGKVPYQFEDIISRWMVAKGMQRDEKKAKAIAWNIHWHGSKYWRTKQQRSKEFYEIITNWEKEDLTEWAEEHAVKLTMDIFKLQNSKKNNDKIEI